MRCAFPLLALLLGACTAAEALSRSADRPGVSLVAAPSAEPRVLFDYATANAVRLQPGAQREFLLAVIADAAGRARLPEAARAAAEASAGAASEAWQVYGAMLARTGDVEGAREVARRMPVAPADRTGSRAHWGIFVPPEPGDRLLSAIAAEQQRWGDRAGAQVTLDAMPNAVLRSQHGALNGSLSDAAHHHRFVLAHWWSAPAVAPGAAEQPAIRDLSLEETAWRRGERLRGWEPRDFRTVQRLVRAGRARDGVAMLDSVPSSTLSGSSGQPTLSFRGACTGPIRTDGDALARNEEFRRRREIRRLAREGDAAGALALAEVRDVAPQVGSENCREALLAEVALGLAEGGRLPAALGIARGLSQIGNGGNWKGPTWCGHSWRTGTVTRIALRQALLGDTEGAIGTAGTIQPECDVALPLVVGALLLRDDLGDALRVANAVESPARRVETYALMALAQRSAEGPR